MEALTLLHKSARKGERVTCKLPRSLEDLVLAGVSSMALLFGSSCLVHTLGAPPVEIRDAGDSVLAPRSVQRLDARFICIVVYLSGADFASANPSGEAADLTVA